MSLNPARELEKLKDRLSDLFHNRQEYDFHHGTVYVPSDVTIQVPEKIPQFPICSSTSLHSYRVPWLMGGHHDNYLLSSDANYFNPSIVREFLSCLPDTRALLNALPRTLVPEFKLPALANGTDDKLSNWLTLLRWFTTSEFGGLGKPWFYFNRSSTAYSVNGELRDWDELVSLPGLSPLDLFVPFAKARTTAARGTKGNAAQKAARSKQSWDYWRNFYQKHDAEFPEVIACVGCKGVMRCSCDVAAGLLILVSKTGKPPRSYRTVPIGDLKYDVILQNMISILKKHHEKQENDTEPLTEHELAEMLGISQSTVSRKFKLLFRNKVTSPKKKYSQLCKEKGILKALDVLERLGPERTSDMSGIADGASHSTRQSINKAAQHELEIDEADEVEFNREQGNSEEE